MQKPSEIAKSKRRGKNIGMFCSRECSTIYNTEHRKKKDPNCVCSRCGKEFHKSPSKMKQSRSGLFFCSRSCKDAAQSFENGLQEIWPDHYGEGKSVKYRKLAIAKHGARCGECGFDVAAILVVHHKDGNRDNNAVDNLEVLCPNHHALRHCVDGKYDTKNISGPTA